MYTTVLEYLNKVPQEEPDFVKDADEDAGD